MAVDTPFSRATIFRYLLRPAKKVFPPFILVSISLQLFWKHPKKENNKKRQNLNSCTSFVSDNIFSYPASGWPLCGFVSTLRIVYKCLRHFFTVPWDLLLLLFWFCNLYSLGLRVFPVRGVTLWRG